MEVATARAIAIAANAICFTFSLLLLSLAKHPIVINKTQTIINTTYPEPVEGNFVSKYHTLNEASKQFNGRIQLKNKLSFGYIWIPLDRNNPVCPIKLSPEDLEKYKYEQLGKRCYQYSLSGVFLKSYVSTQDAANTLKCSQSSIASVCRKLFFQSNGYIWRYAEDGYIEGVVMFIIIISCF